MSTPYGLTGVQADMLRIIRRHVQLCSSGFHACEYPLDCWAFYPPTGKMAEVVLAGEMRSGDGVKRGVDYIMSRAATESNTGERSAATARDAASAAARADARAAARDAEHDWQFDRLIAWLSANEPADWPLPERRS